MKRLSRINGIRQVKIFLIGLAGVLLLLTGHALGFNSSGLKSTIAPETGHEDLKYDQGDPIGLVIGLVNIEGVDLYTERGFSQLELHRFLSVIDPGGTKHFLGGEVSSGDAPSPIFVSARELIPAEKLPADYDKAILVEDLTNLFPFMKTNLGWYTLEVNLPFIRLYYTTRNTMLGLLGDIADPGDQNWEGTINSNKLQLQVVLPIGVTGAHIKVYVRDETQQPLNQVPVKVFETDAIAGLTLEDAYTAGTPVLTGTTNQDGLAVWNDDLCQAQNDYTAIAYYSEQFQSVLFLQGDTGWAPQCDGTIEKTISFGTAPVAGNYSIFALERLWLRTDAVINDGDVAANSAAPPGLNCDLPECTAPEVIVDQRVYAHDGVQIAGDSIVIKEDASVFDVICNELENLGTIRGQQITPLNLPVWTPPAFRDCTPGTGNVYIDPAQSLNLSPGSYNNIVIGNSATLFLAAGTYHINFLELKDNASLICQGPVEVRIKTRFECDQDNFVGPSADSGYRAKDMVFYVGGVDEAADEYAVEIDRRSIIKANIYSPNGTLYSEEDCRLEGSFIGKIVEVGIRTTVSLDSAFGGTSSPCDLDPDGDVDGKDLFAFQLAYSQNLSTADVNKDGAVNPADVNEFASHFGKTGPVSPPPAPLQSLAAGSALDSETANVDKKSKRPRFKSKKVRKVNYDQADTDKVITKEKKRKKKQSNLRRKHEK
jgi:hypothetical protein